MPSPTEGNAERRSLSAKLPSLGGSGHHTRCIRSEQATRVADRYASVAIEDDGGTPAIALGIKGDDGQKQFLLGHAILIKE